MQNDSFLSRLWMRHQRFLPRLRRAILISVIASLILLDTYTYLTLRANISSIIIGEIFQILSFFPYVYAKDRRLGIFTFSTTLLIVFYASASQLSWAWILTYAIVADLIAELIQQLRRDIADSLHDDLAADLTRMLIISRSIRLPHGDDRDRVLDLQDRTQQALAHLRLLIHNLAVSQGPPKEEPTLQEIVDSSASTLAQREIVLDADLDGIERIPALHRSELGRLLVAFIRENTLNALKYNFPHDLVSLVVEQERDTLFISFSAPWHDQKVPEEMHGGYGLWALQDRFENAGGSLGSNRIGASWTVLASLPWNEIATPTTTARSLMSSPDGAAYA